MRGSWCLLTRKALDDAGQSCFPISWGCWVFFLSLKFQQRCQWTGTASPSPWNLRSVNVTLPTCVQVTCAKIWWPRARTTRIHKDPQGLNTQTTTLTALQICIIEICIFEYSNSIYEEGTHILHFDGCWSAPFASPAVQQFACSISRLIPSIFRKQSSNLDPQSHLHVRSQRGPRNFC